MKLLGWMHRKFRQNKGDAGKDLDAMFTCLYCLSGPPNSSPAILRRDSIQAETAPPSIPLDGLLHIGTFGSPIEIPEKTENKIEKTTEIKLIAISTELEKEKISGERPSHVVAVGRVPDVCPLRDFLFGSAVETVAKRRRNSLGELIMTSRVAEEVIVKPRPELEEKKKRNKCRRTISGAAAWNRSRLESRILNILRTLQGKIHPENYIASKKLRKPAKYEINGEQNIQTINNGSRNSINHYGWQVRSQKEAEENKNFSTFRESRAIVKNNFRGNREKWIKTDADYLVLEL